MKMVFRFNNFVKNDVIFNFKIHSRSTQRFITSQEHDQEKKMFNNAEGSRVGPQCFSITRAAGKAERYT